MKDLKLFIDELTAAQNHPGLPPSLLYSRFDSRLEYLRCLLDPVPELVSLLKLVQQLVSETLSCD